jgi:NADPH-dependent 2,4-dienoyl-CoA reductase/sulfur reductase-like enzyme
MSAPLVETEVAVVGAGPAGLAAAAGAAEAGARTLILDLFAEPGGQYFMAPSTAPSAASQQRQGARAVARIRAVGATFISGELVWAERTARGFDLAAEGADGPLAIRAQTLIAATGATEVAPVFPGWTLPGVLTAGAAQRLVKTAAAPPGRRIVLAGNGPFLLAVAETLVRAGRPPAAYIEATRLGPRLMAPILRHPGRALEAVRLVAALARSGARRVFGWSVVEALGRDALEAVRIAPLDQTGAPRTEAAVEIEADALCLGWGFRPQVDLTRVLGATHAHDPRLGGWLCRVDPDTGATDVAGLFAAGETTGVAGARAAALSGAIAGRAAAAVAQGRAPEPSPAEASALRATRAFAAALAEAFRTPADPLAAARPETVLCRCEDVTLAEAEAALADGASSALGVKLWTRAGMGPCQGRVCGPLLAALAARRGADPVRFGANAPRLPIRPATVASLEAALSTLDRG